MKFKSILFLGDTHGIAATLFRLQKAQIGRGALIIHVGDFGLGFLAPQLEDAWLGRLNDHLKHEDLKLWVIRGNHDDPKYWDAPHESDYSNIRLIADYTEEKINGKKFLFVGGAISVDRALRIEERDWWSGEEVRQIDTAALRECDVLVCHTGPSFIGPPSDNSHMKWYAEKDPTLIEELTEERQFIEKILNKARPKLCVLGHFHTHEAGEIDGCYFRILDVNELWDSCYRLPRM